MPVYRYYGRDCRGEPVLGLVEKNNRNHVLSYLQQNQITPVDIYLEKATHTHGTASPLLNAVSLSRRVRDEQLIMFCRQMYTVTKAGVSMIHGVKNLFESTPAGALKEALDDILKRLAAGMSLSAAMQCNPGVFSDLFVSMIRVGESSGNIAAIFWQLGHYIERDAKAKKAIIYAIRYPLLVLLAMAFAVVFINVFVIPEFAVMFTRFNAELPLLTRSLIEISTLFVNYWHGLLALFIVIALIFYYGLRSTTGALCWDRYKLTIPIWGTIVRKASLARYARSFALMLKAGVPLANAIGLCSQVIDNAYLSRKIDNIRRGVERGDSLIRTHSQSDIFTPLILQVISAGEESGQVDTLLMDVAEYYEEELEYELKTLGSKIEPLLIVVMSVFVLLLSLGVFLPMWDLYSIQR